MSQTATSPDRRATSAIDQLGTAERSIVPRVGEVVGGKYRIERELGRGGMGAVFAAIHEVTGKRRAIKWMLPSMDPEAGQRFVQEARAAGRLDHPNVVDILDVGEHAGALYLVMEYLHGEPLSALIGRAQLALDDAARILLPVMRGVRAAHEAGIIHRDLKPENIFLAETAGGRRRGPVVLDFGVSKVHNDMSSGPKTKSEVAMGTPHYMAPEQFDASRVDGRADVYALGVVLFEMLTGVVPFDDPSFPKLILQIIGTPAPQIRSLRPDLPPSLERVVARALTKDPEDRFESVAAFARALEPYADLDFEPSEVNWRRSELVEATEQMNMADVLALEDETQLEPLDEEALRQLERAGVGDDDETHVRQRLAPEDLRISSLSDVAVESEDWTWAPDLGADESTHEHERAALHRHDEMAALRVHREELRATAEMAQVGDSTLVRRVGLARSPRTLALVGFGLLVGALILGAAWMS